MIFVVPSISGSRGVGASIRGKTARRRLTNILSCCYFSALVGAMMNTQTNNRFDLSGRVALEWAREHIRVNAIAPGYIETEMNRDFFATEPSRARRRSGGYRTNAWANPRSW